LSEARSESKEDQEETGGEDEKSQNLEIMRDFFLMVLGIVFGYFASYAISNPSLVGISILIAALTKEITHFPILPSLIQLDRLTRAVGFLILVPVSVILYPLIFARYLRWLRLEQKISLVREITRIFFLMIWPLIAIWIISPQPFLSSTDQIIQRGIGVAYISLNLGFFYYKTRKARRGFLY